MLLPNKRILVFFLLPSKLKDKVLALGTGNDVHTNLGLARTKN